MNTLNKIYPHNVIMFHLKQNSSAILHSKFHGLHIMIGTDCSLVLDKAQPQFSKVGKRKARQLMSHTPLGR